MKYEPDEHLEVLRTGYSEGFYEYQLENLVNSLFAHIDRLLTERDTATDFAEQWRTQANTLKVAMQNICDYEPLEHSFFADGVETHARILARETLADLTNP